MAAVNATRIRKNYLRERKARREAEALLGERSIELYRAGQQIKEVLHLLESEQPLETLELKAAHHRLEKELEARKESERRILERLDTLADGLESQSTVLSKPLEGMLPYLAQLLDSELDSQQSTDVLVLKQTVENLVRLVKGMVEQSGGAT